MSETFFVLKNQVFLKTPLETLMSELTQLESWKVLEKHYEEIKSLSLRQQFAEDSKRFGRFSLEWNGLLFDYSKNRINEQTISLLLDLACC